MSRSPQHLNRAFTQRFVPFAVVFIVFLMTSSIFAQGKANVKPQTISKEMLVLTPDESAELDARLAEMQAVPLMWTGPEDPSLPRISNGCGPQIPLVGWPPWANQHSFTGEKNVQYLVNFKPACDLHDAGYAGLNVWDQFLDDVVPGVRGSTDFSTWSREAVDKKLYRDMLTICIKTIPKLDALAQNSCEGKLGASGYYQMVKRAGYLAFDCDPKTPGTQRSGGPRVNYFGSFDMKQ